MQSPREPCSLEIPLGPQVDGFGCVEQLEQSGRGLGKQQGLGGSVSAVGGGEAGSPGHGRALTVTGAAAAGEGL